MIPGNKGTKHMDGEADVRLAHLQGDEVDGRKYDRLTQGWRYLVKRGATTKLGCKYSKGSKIKKLAR
jgi:hypothetical protein